MKIKIKTYRTVSVAVSQLLSQAGIDYDTQKDLPMAEVIRRFKGTVGPFHPNFEVFWPTAGSLGEALMYRAVVGMGVMEFDILDVKIEGEAKTTRGMVQTDPMDSIAVHHLDGALEGELNRIGVSTNFEGFEYRSSYEVSGN